MLLRISFILFLVIIQCEILLSKSIDPIHINFEFHHQESIAISDTDNDVEEDYDYEYTINDNDSEEDDSRHIRKRRSAKWSPNYDLYEQWAEEYYAQNEKQDEKIASIGQPNESLLDRLINVAQNKTEEEIESDRKEKLQKEEVLKSTLKYGSWTIGIVMIFCCAVTMIKKCWKKFACDFCDAFAYKDKIKRLLNNMVPGVYVHKNGSKEYYIPTKEELEALKGIQKILFSMA